MPKQTVRQQIISLLSQEAHSPKELSQAVGVAERDIYSHLPHIARSLASQNKEFVVIHCRCLECEYLFDSRKRFTRPSRCSRCRGERIQDPRFSVKSRADK